MARGQQKIQSQQKNAERQENGRNLIELFWKVTRDSMNDQCFLSVIKAKLKKAKGSDQKKAAQAALKIICGVSTG